MPMVALNAELHGDEGPPILLANVVDAADIGMIQGRRSLRFALETSQGLAIASDCIGQEFQRNETMKASVLGPVDDTHAATA
jgi:hypothetical protein